MPIGIGTARLCEGPGDRGRAGRVRLTIKDGIVYDARQILADVAALVAELRAEFGEQPAWSAEDQ